MLPHSLVDMIACEQNQCLYLANSPDKRVHRLELQNRAASWSVEEEPSSLSLNRSYNVLVICPAVRQIKEYSSDGKILREVELPTDILRPLHAVQLRRGEFVVCHGDLADGLHRVCTVSADGKQIVRSNGGHSGAENGQYNGPVYLAVDDQGAVYVVDHVNKRVKVLSAALSYLRQVVTPRELKGLPSRMCFGVNKQLLYVADNEMMEGKCINGRVVVVRIRD